MQLINIKSVPIEYRLRITNAELRLAEAQKDRKDTYKDAVVAQKQGESAVAQPIGAKFSRLAPNADAPAKEAAFSAKNASAQQAVDNSKNAVEEHYFGGSEVTGETDIATRLAYEADQEAGVKPLTIEQQYQAKILVDFNNRLSASDFVRSRSEIGVSGEDFKPVSTKTDVSKYDKIKEAYLETQRQYEFVRGSIDIEIVQKPHVEIEYVGGQMYVPPSSNPDYKEPFYATA